MKAKTPAERAANIARARERWERRKEGRPRQTWVETFDLESGLRGGFWLKDYLITKLEYKTLNPCV